MANQKLIYELEVRENGTMVFTWNTETPFGTISKGDSFIVPGWDKDMLVDAVYHEIQEHGGILKHRIVVFCVD
jgi:hypothetical protein